MEADFQRFYHLDYRDYYRPRGGESRLTTRRMLLLVDQLPPESAFWSAVHDRVPISMETSALYSLYRVWTGEDHPAWTQMQRQRDEAERAVVMAEAREKARQFNQARSRAVT